jgi:hypothetical protein
MKSERYLVGAECLDGLIELKPVAVDLDTSLLSDGFSDIGCCHRPEQLPFGAGAHWEAYYMLDQAAGYSFSELAVMGVLGLSCAAHRRRLLSDARAGSDGAALREKEVAGVAIGDITNVTPLAEVGHVRAEDDLHHASVFASSGPRSASMS